MEFLHSTFYIIALISSLTMAGLYGVFHNTIMPTLAQLPPVTAAAVMQRINRTIQNPLFLMVFLLSCMSGPLLVIFTYLNQQVVSWHQILAAVLMFSSVLSTIKKNVPLNNQLDQTPLTPADINGVWKSYLIHWNPWNAYRFYACLLAGILLSLNLI